MAFAEIYDIFSESLYGVILSIVKNEHDASDVLQESFLKIWKKIASYNPQKGTFFTWILNITRNTAIDKFRVNNVNRRNVKLNDEIANVSHYGSIKIDFIGLKELLGNLNPEQIEVVDKLFFKGATHIEAAKELNLPLGTVKSRIRAALIKLRKYYESSDYDKLQ